MDKLMMDANGEMFTLTLSWFGSPMPVVTLVLFLSLMSVVAVIDWRYLVIPDELVAIGLVIGALVNAATGVSAILVGLLSSAGAFVTLSTVRLIGNAMLKQESMGFGDVKLGAVVGLFLGFQGFMVALWSAAVVGLLLVAVYSSRNQFAWNEHIPGRLPFGSFLALTSSVVLLFQQPINGLITQWLTWQQ